MRYPTYNIYQLFLNGCKLVKEKGVMYPGGRIVRFIPEGVYFGNTPLYQFLYDYGI